MISLEAQNWRRNAARMKAAIGGENLTRTFMGVAGDVVAAYSGLTSYEFNFDFGNFQATIKFLTDFPSDGVSSDVQCL